MLKMITNAMRKQPAEHRDINEFKVVVRRLMQEARLDNKPCVFGNQGPEYARVVVDSMVESAENEICIFAQQMSCDVYDAPKFKAFLERCPNGKIRIVVEDSNAPTAKTSALSELSKEIDEKKIVVSVLDRGQEAQLDERNFCVVDGIHVRFEEVQATREATVVFGDEDIGSIAADRFREIEQSAVRYIPLKLQLDSASA